eukprot:CAMPEP_0119124202 /NCGR_PEP_ID=MMETSP1310-20130426/3891_1 /TAXON_ID=464262 /ORGANISM="Genus nov. species nov., Strain RCC2339" /LENGTH=315 /DNA_ID=CAMNT_0007114119 /DNA_START=118 /DNA_END=1062 /DNA_ORIENTATION=+
MRKDCWIIVGAGVYDVSSYLRRHPGGADLIFRNAGKDATRDFTGMFHSRNASLVLEQLRVGSVRGRQRGGMSSGGMGLLSPSFAAPPRSSATSRGTASAKKSGPYGLGTYQGTTTNAKKMTLPANAASREVRSNRMQKKGKPTRESERTPTIPGLHSSIFRKLPLHRIVPLTVDVSIFRFALRRLVEKDEDDTFSEMPFPAGYHVVVKATVQGEQLLRSYTPIRVTEGYLELAIKRYENGKVSRWVHSLTVSEAVTMRGPLPTLCTDADLRLGHIILPTPRIEGEREKESDGGKQHGGTDGGLGEVADAENGGEA